MIARAAGTIATSKPTAQAESIIEHLGLGPAIAFVGGATLDGGRDHKAAIIAHTLEGLGVPTGPDLAFVGDRHHDVEGAHHHGLCAVGVRWGFAEPGELEVAGADVVVDDVPALRRFLVGPDRR